MKNIYFFIIALFFNNLFSQNQTDLDSSLNIGYGFNGFYGSANDVLAKLQNDNKIIICGNNFTSFNGTSIDTNVKIIRINSNGSFDIPFSTITAFFQIIFTLDIQQDGKIIVAGNSTYNRYRILRFLSNGTLDSTFSTGSIPTDGFDNYISKIKIQNDGKILVKGGFQNYTTSPTKNLARLTTSGNLDLNFKNNLNSISQITTISDFALLPNSKVVVLSNFKLFLLNSDGTLDNSFITNTIDFANQFIIQSDGKYLVRKNTSSTYNELIRLNTNGTIDSTFNQYPVYNAVIRSILQIADGSILLNTYGATAVSKRLIKLDIFGNSIPSFDIDGIDLQGGEINNIEQQTDGKLLVSGNFTIYNGTEKHNILRLLGTSVLTTSNNEKNKFVIYPNPVKEIINTSITTIFDFEIYDILGNLVLKGKNIESQVNVNSLTKGIYFLKLTSENNIINQKFIKE